MQPDDSQTLNALLQSLRGKYDIWPGVMYGVFVCPEGKAENASELAQLNTMEAACGFAQGHFDAAIVPNRRPDTYYVVQLEPGFNNACLVWGAHRTPVEVDTALVTGLFTKKARDERDENTSRSMTTLSHAMQQARAESDAKDRRVLIGVGVIFAIGLLVGLGKCESSRRGPL